ncbi:hypothetical protein [Bartonella tamiae]|uniref:Uncharacterized protein n=1 Tax=Bartonella tamiae Th239 TaxID=1094558 RepID=J0ZSA9_9HYPH|nr:hypothetical protein [Bartonella tamiae]EJF91643.1 hypothetical protein ME5_00022 [Bartonella tamiae Th239]EJF92682.1 hypothetical protein MEG_01852 [Bartonella tamiae Th307]
MTTRIIRSESDRKNLIRFLENQKGAVTVTITNGKHRSTHQNRLQRQWVNDLAPQLGEPSEDVRAMFKLEYGVPILRNENEAFKAEYDAIIMPMPYEAKSRLMKVPFDFSVTRLMTVKQYTQFLDNIYRDFTGRGYILTNPDDLKWEKAA